MRKFAMLDCTFYCGGMPSHTLSVCILIRSVSSCHVVMPCGWLCHMQPCYAVGYTMRLCHAVGWLCGCASGCAVNGWWWQLIF